MAYNIPWAKPEVTECWSYRGRLYRSRKKAEMEQEKAKKRIDSYRKNTGDPEFWNGAYNAPIYRIEWKWSEDG